MNIDVFMNVSLVMVLKSYAYDYYNAVLSKLSVYVNMNDKELSVGLLPSSTTVIKHDVCLHQQCISRRIEIIMLLLFRVIVIEWPVNQKQKTPSRCNVAIANV